MMFNQQTPGDNILAGLILEDPRYCSDDPAQYRALFRELRESGFSEAFVQEWLPKLSGLIGKEG